MLRLLASLILLIGVQAAPQRESQANEALKCIDYLEFKFYCVPFHQCNENFTIITTGAGLFDPRSDDCDPSIDDCSCPDKDRALLSMCNKNLEVCCLHPTSKCNTPTNTPTPSTCISIFDDGNCIDGLTPTTPTTTTCDPIFASDNCISGSTVAIEPPPKTRTAPSTLSTPTTPTTPATPTTCDPVFGDDCISGPVKPSKPTPVGCGLRNLQGIGNLTSVPQTNDAEFGEWPHVCAVLRKESLGSQASTEADILIYQCGASLLDYGVILTGAHCLHNIKPENIIIRCGEHDTQSLDEPLDFQQRNVGTVKIHPKFDIGTLQNNFAILYLTQDFLKADHIFPICLPEPCAKYTDQNCVANGWGKDKFGSDGRFSTILKEVAYPIVDNPECQNILRTTRLGEYFELDESFMCAGGVKGVDTCKGDGGSPLNCEIQGTDRWVQAGIVSWGIGCGEEGIPAVYARVNTASCWVDDEVTKYFGSQSSYFGFNAADCDGPNPVGCPR